MNLESMNKLLYQDSTDTPTVKSSAYRAAREAARMLKPRSLPTYTAIRGAKLVEQLEDGKDLWALLQDQLEDSVLLTTKRVINDKL